MMDTVAESFVFFFFSATDMSIIHRHRAGHSPISHTWVIGGLKTTVLYGHNHRVRDPGDYRFLWAASGRGSQRLTSNKRMKWNHSLGQP